MEKVGLVTLKLVLNPSLYHKEALQIASKHSNDIHFPHKCKEHIYVPVNSSGNQPEQTNSLEPEFKF